MSVDKQTYVYVGIYTFIYTYIKLYYAVTRYQRWRSNMEQAFALCFAGSQRGSLYLRATIETFLRFNLYTTQRVAQTMIL